MEKISKFAKIYLALVFIILYAPIFYLIFYSFNSGGTMNSISNHSLGNIMLQYFHDTRLIMILINTVIVALLSALIATIIGVFGALGIVFMRNKAMRNAILSLNNVLIVSPDVSHRCIFLNLIYNDWC